MWKILLFVACGALVCEGRRARASQIQSYRYKSQAKTVDEATGADIAANSYSRVRSNYESRSFEKLHQLLFALRPSARTQLASSSVPMAANRASPPKQLFQSRAPEPPPPPEPQPFISEGVRGQLRVFGIFGLWAALIAYVVLLAPGKGEVAQALDADLLAKLIANPFDQTVTPFFACVFNFMGLWPAWYAAVLLPGGAQQKPLPVAPPLVGSVAFGMFALSPYLALREYRDSDVTQADLNGVSRWFEGKLNAILLSLGAVSLCVYGVTANDGNIAQSANEYLELFRNQLFVHVTSLDFLSLWALSYGALAEDAKRRGIESPSPLFAAVPILGHMAWLLLRPPLPEK